MKYLFIFFTYNYFTTLLISKQIPSTNAKLNMKSTTYLTLIGNFKNTDYYISIHCS